MGVIELKGSDITYIPTNVEDFESRIMGVKAKNAITLILVVSAASFLLRFSPLLSALIVVSGIVLALPVRKDRTTAEIIARNISWRFSLLQVQSSASAFASSDGLHVLVREGKKLGCILEVISGDFHSLSTDRKREILRTLSTIVSAFRFKATLIAVPEAPKLEIANSEIQDERSRNYEHFVRRLHESQYYYRSYIIVWKEDAQSPDYPDDLLEEMENLKVSLETICRSRTVNDLATARLIIEALR